MTLNKASLLWVEQRIRQLSKELGQPVDCLEQVRPIEARAGQMPLKIWRGGEFRILEVQREWLFDANGDPEIQAPLEYGAVFLSWILSRYSKGTDPLRP